MVLKTKLIFTFLLGFIVFAQAQQNVWLGNTSDWDDTTNWTINVPDSLSNVVIPANTPNSPIITNPALCMSMVVDLNSSLTINNAFHSQSVVNNGSITASDSIFIDSLVVNGNTLSSGVLSIATGIEINNVFEFNRLILSGNYIDNTPDSINEVSNYNFLILKGTSGVLSGQELRVSNVIIEDIAGAKTINDDMSIVQSLTLTEGVIKTGNNKIILSEQAVINGGSSLSYVENSIQFETASLQSRLLPLGANGVYRPIEITPLNVNPTVYCVRAIDNGFNTSQRSIELASVNSEGYWEIDRISGNAAADLRFFWENFNINEATVADNLVIAWWDGNKWISLGKDNFDLILDFAEVNGIGSFGRFTFGELNPSSVFSLNPEAIQFTNPISDILYLENVSNDDQVLNWQIFNSSGRLIYQYSSSAKMHQINSRDWPTGLYILSIQNEKKTQSNTYKLLKF